MLPMTIKKIMTIKAHGDRCKLFIESGVNVKPTFMKAVWEEKIALSQTSKQRSFWAQKQTYHHAGLRASDSMYARLLGLL